VRIDIVTIFPEYFGGFRGAAPPGEHGGGDVPPGGCPGPLGVSLIGKAAARGDIEFAVHDLRRWARDVHRTVDDTPFGGGPGMVMRPEVWGDALDEVVAPGSAGPAPRLIVPTPSGVPFTQEAAAAYADCPRLVFACGRYEGTRMPVDEVSIGDYVLAGGEAAALVIIEAVCRLVPGVLGNESSAPDDSFGGSGPAGNRAMTGLVEGPVYTRPRTWRGREVPGVLLSGDHAAIARWRRDAALLRTASCRPDLIERALADPGSGLDESDRLVLSGAGFPVRGEDMAH
jgi:tRNA (guanine37-N1)-methyltransferase